MAWRGGKSSPKGRQVFLGDMEPFLKWLAEASEEEETDDDSDEEE